MLSFEGFCLLPGEPIYLQILRHIKRGAAAGTVRDGDELPSRRVLSALLGVNPNTVQKAYRLLEEEGLIASHSGAKSYMVLPEATRARIRQELLAQDMRSLIDAMRSMGLTQEEAAVLLGRLWEEEEQ